MQTGSDVQQAGSDVQQDERAEVCYICLQGGCCRDADDDDGNPPRQQQQQQQPLIRPCLCPRPVHEGCLARWQLHCAGREEELHCRFCKSPLPHWRDTLRGSSSSSPSSPPLPPAPQPVMSIQFGESTFWLNVASGAGGIERFKADVRRLLALSAQDEFDITFECTVPLDGSKLELHGLQAYDAAVYCATLTAAERMRHAAAEEAAAAVAAAAPDTTHPSAAAVADAAPTATATATAAASLPCSTDGSQQTQHSAPTGADGFVRQHAGGAAAAGSLDEFMRGHRRQADHTHTAGHRRRRGSGASSSSSGGYSSASSGSSSGLNWLLAKLHGGWQWAAGAASTAEAPAAHLDDDE